MKPVTLHAIRRIIFLASLTALAGGTHAGIIVTRGHIVGGTAPAIGTLVAIDTPFISNANGTTGTFGGPSWTTGGTIFANQADQGFAAPSSPSGDGIRDFDFGGTPWEPDGTSFSQAAGYYIYPDGPSPGTTWTFNLATSGVNLPDGTIIHGVYARFGGRSTDKARYEFTEGAASGNLLIDQTGSGSAGDMVMRWLDADGNSRDANFQRIFSGPITVTGGDGFQLKITDTSSGNAGHIDAIILDTSLPKANDVPAVSTLIPVDNKSGVVPWTSIEATFDEPVTLTGTGTVTITDLTDGSSTRVINLPNPQVTSPNGDDLLIKPTTRLELGTQYSVKISADALVDTAAVPNAFPGILNDTTWNFTTRPVPDVLHNVLIVTADLADAQAVVNTEQAVNIVFHDPRNVDEAMRAASYQQIGLNLGDSSGLPATVKLTYPALTVATAGGSSSLKNRMATSLAALGYNLSLSNFRFILYIQPKGLGGNAEGWANLFSNTSVYKEAFWIQLAMHEMGHCLGGNHSQSNNPGCALGAAQVDYEAPKKILFGWLNAVPGSVVDVSASTTLTLAPLSRDPEILPGIRAVRVADPNGGTSTFVISYRIDDGPYHTLVNSSYSRKVFVSEDVGGALTTHRAALAVGETYTVGKLSVTNNSVAVDGLSAVVNIGVGNPTLVSIADNVSGGPITVGQSVNFTATFDEAINAATIGTDDFENGSTAGITVNSITATANPAVFTVAVTTTSAGNLNLRIKAGAVITDLSGSPLNTFSPLPDNTTIAVNPLSAPSLLSIADNAAGGPVTVGGTVAYTITFDEAINAATLGTDDFENGSSAGLTVTSVSTTANPAVFTVAVTTTTPGTLTLQIKAGAVVQDLNGSTLGTASALPDNTTITVKPSSAPILLSIVDNVAGGPVIEGNPVSFTVTFDEAINAATIGTNDFENGSSADIVVNSVTATANPAVFTVNVTTIFGGDLTLQIKAGAVIADAAGFLLDTSSALPDDTTISVNPPPPPTLLSITDNVGGGPISVGGAVTYTVTFDKAINPATLGTNDFENGSSAGITVNSATATANPAVFTVAVTTTAPGTLTLRIKAGAVIEDTLGLPLGTLSPLPDNTTITVYSGNGNWIITTTNGNWSTAANWNSNPSPAPGTTAGSIVGLNSNINGNRSVTIDTISRTVGTLNIGDADNSHSFTLSASGGATLTFHNNGTAAALNETGSLTDTVGAPVILRDNLTVNAAGIMSLAGVISETGGARSITKTGAGNVSFGSAIANTYSGGFTLNAGGVNFGNNSFGTSTLNVNGGSFALNFQTTANHSIWNSSFSLTRQSSDATWTHNGNVTMNNNISLNIPSTGAFGISLTINGTIGETGGARSLTLPGTSAYTITLGGANTYSGGTIVNGATTLNLNNASAIGSGKLTISSASAMLNNSSGSAITLTTNNAQDWNANLTFAGTNSLNMGTGAVTMNDNRTVTVTANTLTIGGNIGQSGGTRTLTKAGNGTLRLGGTNSYSGATTVSAGTLALVGGSHNSAITVNSGAKAGFTLGSPTTSTKALNLIAGHTVTITGTVNNASNYRLITASSITGAPALTAAIPDYQLQLQNSNTELWLVYTGPVATPYETWSGGAPFDGDANSDGVADGIAFLLGAAGSNENAIGHLPTVTQNGGSLVVAFDYLAATERGTAQLSIQHSSDLGVTDAWTNAPVPGTPGNSIVGNVDFVVTDPGAPGGLLNIVATVQASQAIDGKLFIRLRANP